MPKLWRTSLFLLPVALTVSCGSSNGRELQSISISQTAIGSKFQFTAMGTFSEAPMSVSPLPVDWSNGLLAPPPPHYSYALTTQPYVVDCSGTNPGATLQVSALAPQDPNAPSSGTTKSVVVQSHTFTCP